MFYSFIGDKFADLWHYCDAVIMLSVCLGCFVYARKHELSLLLCVKHIFIY